MKISLNYKGFREYTIEKDETHETVPEKYLWDWLDLLVIPFIIAISGYYLNRSEERRKREIASEERKADQIIAQNHRDAEQQQALERQREESLQNYIDKMSELLLTHELKQVNTKNTNNQEARNVARAKTMAVVRTLDGKRKGLVLKFLFDAGLISGEKPIINLEYADFSETTYPNAYLGDANLKLVDFSNARLERVEFDGAILTQANFSNAILHGGKFREKTILDGTELKDADLGGVYVADMDIRNIEFKVSGTADTSTKDYRPGDMSNSIWMNCSFTGCSFSGIQFNGSRFESIKFRDQIFTSVIFQKSNFNDVDFSGSKFGSTTYFGSEFVNTNFSDTDLYDITFEASLFRGVTFVKSKMNKVNLKYTTVKYEVADEDKKSVGVDFSGAELIKDVNIFGAAFSDDQVGQAKNRQGIVEHEQIKDSMGERLLGISGNKIKFWFRKK